VHLDAPAGAVRQRLGQRRAPIPAAADGQHPLDAAVGPEEEGDDEVGARARGMPEQPPQEQSVDAADLELPQGLRGCPERTPDAEVVDPRHPHRRTDRAAFALQGDEAVNESLRGQVGRL
jgi:hypothetical protein